MDKDISYGRRLHWFTLDSTGSEYVSVADFSENENEPQVGISSHLGKYQLFKKDLTTCS